MPGLGTLELCIIAVVALFVIGPDRLPEFARIVMRIWRDLRRYSDEIRREIETPLYDIKDTLREAKRDILDTTSLDQGTPHQLPKAVSGDDYDPYEDIVEDVEYEYEEGEYDSADIEEDVQAADADVSDEDGEPDGATPD
ncbi:twin-arginine translocase TatA/TatE family subunit [Candidatus Hydrogenedentota bacterium]